MQKSTRRPLRRRVRLAAHLLESRAVPAIFNVTLLGDLGAVDPNDPTQQSGDLRYCISKANSLAGADTVAFSPNLALTDNIKLNSELLISDSVLVTSVGAGNVPTIDGQKVSRLFRIDIAAAGSKVTIERVNLRDGQAGVQPGGAIYAQKAGSLALTECVLLDNSASLGGAVATSFVDLTVVDCSFSGNSATTDGGAVFVEGRTFASTGTDYTLNTAEGNSGAVCTNIVDVTMVDAGVGDNTAAAGGGLFFTRGTATVTDSRIARLSGAGNANKAGYGGGLVSDAATVTINGTTNISENESTGAGGGITASGTLTILGTTVIDRNIAKTSGGGIYFSGQSLTVGSAGAGGDCALQLNIAEMDGGGICAVQGTVKLAGASVCFNAAKNNGGGLAAFNGFVEITANSYFLANQRAGMDPINSLRGGGVYSECPTVILDSKFEGNVSLLSGGGVEVTTTSGRLTMTGSHFISDNTGTGVLDSGTGGGVCLSNGSSTAAAADVIRSTTFEGCLAVNGGGVAIIGARQVSLEQGCTFTTCGVVDLGAGGGLYVAPDASSGVSPTVVVTGATFDNNNAQFGGAMAVINNAASVTIGSSTFTNNRYESPANNVSRGGGLYVGGVTPVPGKVTVSACTFGDDDDNLANRARFGGAIAVHKSNATVTINSATTLLNNSGYGGGLAVTGIGKAVVTVDKSSILDNQASFQSGPFTFGQGGGVYIADTDASVTLTKTTLAGNIAAEFGGGIAITGTGNPTVLLTGCTIGGPAPADGNQVTNAGADGGGIAVRDTGGSVTVVNCSFVYNAAGSGGAGGGLALVASAAPVTVMGCEFLNNSATGGFGGGIGVRDWLDQAGKGVDNTINIFATVVGAKIDGVSRGNTAGSGAGISVVNSSAGITVDLCDIVSNSATGSEGGGIHLDDAALFQLGSSTIALNQTNGSGGGIAVVGTTNAFIDGSTIDGNYSTLLTTGGQGGGIFVTGQPAEGAKLQVTGTTLSYNEAPYGGGIACADNSGDVILVNCTLSHNVALGGLPADPGFGGGVFINAQPPEFILANSTVAFNVAGLGGGLFWQLSEGGAFNIQSSILSNNSAAGGTDVAGADIQIDQSNGTTIVTAHGAIIRVGAINAKFGYSVFDDFAGAQIGTPASPLDPRLLPLDYYGGPTRTHALEFVSTGDKSIAIDMGYRDNKLIGNLAYDQRGYHRTITKDKPLDPIPDAGAYELQAPRVRLVEVNDGSAQHSMVTSVRVTFDQIVALPATPETAFKLQRQSDGALVGLAATANNTNVPGTVVTLTFTGGPLDFASLADGRYAVTVFAAQVASLYDGFDGNTLLNPGDSPPDGYAGGDYVLLSNGTTGVFRLFGDASGDASVGFDDLAAFQAAFGTNNFAFDFDGNGTVDAEDYKQFRLRYRESLP